LLLTHAVSAQAQEPGGRTDLSLKLSDKTLATFWVVDEEGEKTIELNNGGLRRGCLGRAANARFGRAGRPLFEVFGTTGLEAKIDARPQADWKERILGSATSDNQAFIALN